MRCEVIIDESEILDCAVLETDCAVPETVRRLPTLKRRNGSLVRFFHLVKANLKRCSLE